MITSGGDGHQDQWVELHNRLQDFVGPRDGLQPFLGVVAGFRAPLVEDLVMLGWVDHGILCWCHVELRSRETT